MGRTRWARFVGVLGIGTVGAGALLFGMSQGALAASFAVSGTNFKVSSDSLTGQGFVQFGGVDAGAGQVHVVAVSGFKSATLDKFCQSVFVANMPIVGDITLRITADGVGGMSADNLVVNLTDLSGDLTLGNPEIGVDANKVNKGPDNLRGLPGSFGLQADSANITGLKQTAWSTTAQTIRFKGMNLTIRQGQQECF
ncbi:DUF6230 family protein [Lentzea sp.]|uniref:DUF6230 family protein n=1 Tax=Lentzea sp. TaxID=56099 RepID=UPI002ED3A35B